LAYADPDANQPSMPKKRQSPGLPMTIANMRQLGARHLIAWCLINASEKMNDTFVEADTEVREGPMMLSFRRKMRNAGP